MSASARQRIGAAKKQDGKMQEATKVSKLASAVQWAERIMRKIDNVYK
jgi:hypothetical protein